MVSTVRFGTIYQIIAPTRLVTKSSGKAFAESLKQYGTNADLVELRFAPEADGFYVLTENDLTDYMEIQRDINDVSIGRLDLTFRHQAAQANPQHPDPPTEFQAEMLEHHNTSSVADLLAFFQRVAQQAKPYTVDAEGRKIKSGS